MNKCFNQNIGKLGASWNVNRIDFTGGLEFIDDVVAKIDMLSAIVKFKVVNQVNGGLIIIKKCGGTRLKVTKVREEVA